MTRLSQFNRGFDANIQLQQRNQSDLHYQSRNYYPLHRQECRHMTFLIAMHQTIAVVISVAEHGHGRTMPCWNKLTIYQVGVGKSTFMVTDSYVQLADHLRLVMLKVMAQCILQHRCNRRPTPTIPDFCRLALSNVLSIDPSESFKFQILTDHLKLEEALLVADSYSHSFTPFSDTMTALTEIGQPHQLAFQRITKLMEGPNIREWGQRPLRVLPFVSEHWLEC